MSEQSETVTFVRDPANPPTLTPEQESALDAAPLVEDENAVDEWELPAVAEVASPPTVRKGPGRPVDPTKNFYKTRVMYAEMLAQGKTRKETVKAFIDQLGMPAASASTYFQAAQKRYRESELANSGTSV